MNNIKCPKLDCNSKDDYDGSCFRIPDKSPILNITGAKCPSITTASSATQIGREIP